MQSRREKFDVLMEKHRRFARFHCKMKCEGGLACQNVDHGRCYSDGTYYACYLISRAQFSMDGYIGRILLPTDFSPESFRALQYAVTLVDPHISEIVLVHVVEPLPRGVSRWSDPSKLLETNRAQAQSKLSEFERNARALYPHCRSELQVGNPSRVIAELASKLNVDLIVMSAHKRNGILDRLLESLPEKLLRIAPCPVLAVGTWAHPMSHERSMLALDGLA